MISRLNSFDGR